VARLQLTVRRPYHLKPEEARDWLRAEAATLRGVEGVASMTVARLGAVGGRWASDGDWLIELELDDDADPSAVVRSEACAVLLGDLRLLGMRPSLAVVREAWRVD
jgi:hypothetical protein